MPAPWKSTLAMLLAITLGCTAQPPAQPKPAAPVKHAATVPPAAAAKDAGDDAVAVTLIDADGLQAAIEKHAGKVVLVDCWATWCVPCVKDFPHTVELSRKHAADGLVVMSLSFDDPVDGQVPNKVRKFLQDKDARFEHYLSQLDLADEGASAFAIDEGALPHYKLYDREGKLIRSFSAADELEPVTHESIAAAVAEALQP